MKLKMRFKTTDGGEVDICPAEILRVSSPSLYGGEGTHSVELVSGLSHQINLAASLETGVAVVDTDAA